MSDIQTANFKKRKEKKKIKVIGGGRKMDDDTLYFPRTDFEWELKEEKGFPFFRRYRIKLEEDKKKEKELLKK